MAGGVGSFVQGRTSRDVIGANARVKTSTHRFAERPRSQPSKVVADANAQYEEREHDTFSTELDDDSTYDQQDVLDLAIQPEERQEYDEYMRGRGLMGQYELEGYSSTWRHAMPATDLSPAKGHSQTAHHAPIPDSQKVGEESGITSQPKERWVQGRRGLPWNQSKPANDRYAGSELGSDIYGADDEGRGDMKPQLPLSKLQESKEAPKVEPWEMRAVEAVQQEVSGQSTIAQGEKRALDLDYTEEQLKSMPFSKLATESFDFDPARSKPNLSKDLASKPLPDQLRHLTTLQGAEDDIFQRQVSFFNSLPLDKYEESGDIIVDQFAEILGKFKDLRKKKREAARRFEEEVAEREEGVKERMDALGADLKRLKRSGEEVVRAGR